MSSTGQITANVRRNDIVQPPAIIQTDCITHLMVVIPDFMEPRISIKNIVAFLS
jgi:hypothetical protein